MAISQGALVIQGLVRQGGATRLEQVEVGKVQSPRAGFDEVYLAHRTAIYGYVRRMVRSEEDAEDLTVLTFEKALKAWGRRPPDGEMRPWLFRIATNSCLDELRRRQRIQWRPWETFASIFHPSQIAPDNPEAEVIRNESGSLVRAALDSLPPRDRAALVLREYQGMSVEEVGRALNISTDAAKTALFRARERLRVAYTRMGGEAPEGSRHARNNGGSGAGQTEGPIPGGRERQER